MPKPEPTALSAAAAAFDQELATYARLGELFVKAPLETLKHLERANTTLDELAQSEQRLQDCGQKLIAALAGARERQEQMAKRIVEQAPALKARNGQLEQLMITLHALAAEVTKINQQVVDQNAAGAADPIDVSTAVLELSNRAEQIAATAHEASFSEVADQAHALHQRLQALAKKLSRAAGN